MFTSHLDLQLSEQGKMCMSIFFRKSHLAARLAVLETEENLDGLSQGPWLFPLHSLLQVPLLLVPSQGP